MRVSFSDLPTSMKVAPSKGSAASPVHRLNLRSCLVKRAPRRVAVACRSKYSNSVKASPFASRTGMLLIIVLTGPHSPLADDSAQSVGRTGFKKQSPNWVKGGKAKGPPAWVPTSLETLGRRSRGAFGYASGVCASDVVGVTNLRAVAIRSRMGG